MSEPSRKEFWLLCPICGGKTRTRVQEDTLLVHFPLFCPKCRAVTRINYSKEHMVLCEEPDA